MYVHQYTVTSTLRFSLSDSYPYKVRSQGPFGGGQWYSPKGDRRAGKTDIKLLTYACWWWLNDIYVNMLGRGTRHVSHFRINIECNVLPILGFIRPHKGRKEHSTINIHIAHTIHTCTLAGSNDCLTFTFTHNQKTLPVQWFPMYSTFQLHLYLHIRTYISRYHGKYGISLWVIRYIPTVWISTETPWD